MQPPTNGNRWGVELYLHLSVCFFTRYLKNRSPNVTYKCSTMSSRMSFIFGVKRSKVKVTSQKDCWGESVHSCECWLLLVGVSASRSPRCFYLGHRKHVGRYNICSSQLIPWTLWFGGLPDVDLLKGCMICNGYFVYCLTNYLRM